METLMGLVMIYTWIHGSIIVGKKVKDTSTYEVAVMIAGLVFFLLYIMGTL